jgi:hypothetical protein
MRYGPPSRRPPKTSSATPTGPAACPGAPASTTLKTWPSRSAISSPSKSSKPACGGRPKARPPNRSAAAPAAAVSPRTSPPSHATSTPAPGRSPGTSPPATAPAAGGLFFPQSRSLGLDRTAYSPALQDKVVYAGVSNPSFEAASQDLAKLAEVAVPAKQVERLTKGVGLERCAERDEAVAAYQALPLPRRKGAPDGVTAPEVAVVSTDGGRIQVLDRRARGSAPEGPAEHAGPTPAGHDPHERGRHWREDKVGLLLAMASEESAADPCPDVPEGFLDPTRIGQLVRQLRKGVPATEEPARPAEDPEAGREVLQGPGPGPGWQPPEVEHKRLVASRQSWDRFGPVVAAAAWAMGLFGAARRAFVGDGAENNWSLWRGYFSSFVPILDFIHALSYVYAAAHAGRDRAEGWRCYARWIRWVWRGQVAEVLRELRQRQEELGPPQAQDKETSPRVVVDTALTYLRNNAGRMRYEEYRRRGLPITSSYVESAVKQFNQRVKGTEKFWSEEGAEAILQLRADHLSDDQPLEAFWQRRQGQTTGQRPYRRVA